MDLASIVLAEALDLTRLRTYDTLAEDSKVARTTVRYCAHG